MASASVGQNSWTSSGCNEPTEWPIATPGFPRLASPLATGTRTGQVGICCRYLLRHCRYPTPSRSALKR